MPAIRQAQKRGNGRGLVWFDEGTGLWRWSITIGTKANSEGKRIPNRTGGREKTKTAAEKELSKAIADHDRKVLAAPDRITVNEYAEIGRAHV